MVFTRPQLQNTSNSVRIEGQYPYNRLMPNGLTSKANTKNINMVNSTQAESVNTKPHLGSKYGNSKNIGKVGITYQKV